MKRNQHLSLPMDDAPKQALFFRCHILFIFIIPFNKKSLSFRCKYPVHRKQMLLPELELLFKVLPQS